MLNGRNHELIHPSIKALCLHSSRSTPLRKTPIPNHYLHINYFLYQKDLVLNFPSPCLSFPFLSIRKQPPNSEPKCERESPLLLFGLANAMELAAPRSVPTDLGVETYYGWT